MSVLVDTLRDLWSILDRRSRYFALFLIVLLVVSGIFELAGVLMIFGYISSLSNDGDSGILADAFRHIGDGSSPAASALTGGVLLMTALLAKNMIGLGSSFLLLRFSMKRFERVSADIYEAYLNCPIEILQQQSHTERQQILESAREVFRQGFNQGLAALSEIVILITMFAAVTLLVNASALLVACLLLGAAGIVFITLTRRMVRSLGRRRMIAASTMAQMLLDGMRGVIDHRLSGRVPAMVARYRRAAGIYSLADRRENALQLAPRALNELILAAGIVSAGVYFSSQPGGMGDSLPIIAVLAFAGLRITASVSRLSASIQSASGIDAERRRLMNTLAEYVRIYRADTETALQPQGTRPALAREIRLENVSYAYPGTKRGILSVSLRIGRGERVGLCGRSGSGKSTLALVIMGLLRPNSGQVFCDDWDVATGQGAWYRQFGYLGQSPYLSFGSLRENIAFGFDPTEIDDRAVWRALEIAALDDVARALPQGLDTPLGDEGARFSGGQRQRIAIARALYRDPEILVLDEATSALDSVTEAAVNRAIASMASTKTVIIIAHRLSTLREASVVFYMEAGRVTAQGTFGTLKRDCPSFRNMLKGLDSDVTLGRPAARSEDSWP